MIRVQAEFIEMPEATYTKLISIPRTPTNDTDLRAGYGIDELRILTRSSPVLTRQ
ncbi:MAG: hypothetical protein OSB05_11655 [Akkermansiaceae bacterium]|nr:hypothetical protein [Akkermansiaceae bacterium]